MLLFYSGGSSTLLPASASRPINISCDMLCLCRWAMSFSLRVRAARPAQGCLSSTTAVCGKRIASLNENLINRKTCLTNSLPFSPPSGQTQLAPHKDAKMDRAPGIAVTIVSGMIELSRGKIKTVQCCKGRHGGQEWHGSLLDGKWFSRAALPSRTSDMGRLLCGGPVGQRRDIGFSPSDSHQLWTELLMRPLTPRWRRGHTASHLEPITLEGLWHIDPPPRAPSPNVFMLCCPVSSDWVSPSLLHPLSPFIPLLSQQHFFPFPPLPNGLKHTLVFIQFKNTDR